MANFILESPIAVTIPSGAAVSNIMEARKIYGSGRDMTLFAPATLDAHTYIIQLTYDAAPAAGGNWVTWSDGSADIAPAAAGKGRQYSPLPACTGWRIKDSSGNVAADRTWQLILRDNAY